MKAIFTGGGTVGHVMVNSVLIPQLAREGWDCIYVGSHTGAERGVIEGQGIARYHSVSTGKLRRYLSWQNLWDCGRVVWGFFQALALLRRERPQVICSGGGFVSVPVVLAGQLLGIPTLLRETDRSLGLANKLCLGHARQLFVTFEDTAEQAGDTPCTYGGLIIRPELLEAQPPEQYRFGNDKPVLLVLGGSLGSPVLGNAVRDSLPELLEEFNILHLCGGGKVDATLQGLEGYRQYDYIAEMGPVYAAADLVLTRCGSGAISEGLALGKRMICVPISTRYSRGEQGGNALYAVANGTAALLEEQELSADALLATAQHLLDSPIKAKMLLTPELLQSNCARQLDAIQALGTEQRRNRFLRRLRRGRPIDWEQLDDSELTFFAEISEEYEFCGG